ncbi:hypothetical protein NKDENANG_04174 [Candidatus Entotheonellaceae bacterium PAL068K]
MGDDKQQQSSQAEDDSSLLTQHEAFHHFMRKYSVCQQEVKPDWQARAHCGTRLDTSCPDCGNALPLAGANACPSCGLTIPLVSP